MSILNRKRPAPADPDATATPPAPAEPSGTSPSGTSPSGTSPSGTSPSGTSPSGPVSGTRTSAAWLGICLAAVILVVLIIFLLQNTSSVDVSFLWMHGRLPLSIALMIAAVGAALLTMTVGVARITQLRRRFRQNHH
jgi:uncharacterized integral membrane protein